MTDDYSLRFTALDRTERTDTWLSNHEEMARETDPWDPDTDDDGLTDGQEAKWLTTVQEFDSGPGPGTYDVNRGELIGTNASKNDTDDDGYWDGWIGVYDVGRTDNVVLYMEHLRDDDDGDGETDDEGVQDDEVVPEQIGIHDQTDAPIAGGADIIGSSAREHSNLHIGELHWRTDPLERQDQPAPSLSVEVDFYGNSDKDLWQKTGDRVTSEWATAISDNYALYGIEVELTPHEVLNDSDLPDLGPVHQVRSPFSELDIALVHDREHDLNTDQYLFVADESDLQPSLGGDSQTGINFYSTSGNLVSLLPGVDVRGITIFTDNMQRDTNTRDVIRASGRQDALVDNGIGLVSAKTTIHEFGHSLEVGETDDDCLVRPELEGEIYSGEKKDNGDYLDETPEIIDSRDEWSVMASGWDDDMLISPMKGRYVSFSNEELTTIKTGGELPCV